MAFSDCASEFRIATPYLPTEQDVEVSLPPNEERDENRCHPRSGIGQALLRRPVSTQVTQTSAIRFLQRTLLYPGFPVSTHRFESSVRTGIWAAAFTEGLGLWNSSKGFLFWRFIAMRETLVSSTPRGCSGTKVQ